MTVQQVLQVNIRLSEGGAAGVARALADGLRSLGVASPFAYGYGKKGGASPLEAAYDGIKVTPAAVAALNRISYSLQGRETPLRGPGWLQLREAIAASDIVHLHAVHSYFASTEGLFNEIIRAGKPVVWTLHDQWAMTGRCAQPGTCRRWENGCASCPDLKAYPPARIDRAAARWPERRALIRELQDSVPTRVVACADWLGEEAELAGIQNVAVVKNSVDPEFWSAVTVGQRPRPKHSNLFLCRDLRDPNKVNWDVLHRVAELPSASLTIVGDNPTRLPSTARHIPAVSDRTDLAHLLLEHENMIFTSSVDYFPLTIAEALTAGVHVFALDSRAAREFQRHPGLSIFANEDALLAGLAGDMETRSYSSADTSDFDPMRMVRDYMTHYLELSAG